MMLGYSEAANWQRVQRYDWLYRRWAQELVCALGRKRPTETERIEPIAENKYNYFSNTARVERELIATGKATASELRIETGMTTREVADALKCLEKSGKVKRIGRGKSNGILWGIV